MKVHLKDSAEPLKEGTDLEALCGKEIPKAKFAMMWNEGDMGFMPAWNRLAFCRKCCDQLSHPDRRYWYGLVPGQESEEANARL